jgi:hypothetical protein
VASNRERINIVHRKTLFFAQEKCTFAIRWRNDSKKWQNYPVLPAECTALQNTDPCFWQYFVPGADGFLTANLNNNLGPANGSPIKLHSLSFASEDQLETVLLQMHTLPVGAIITLEELPVAVNIQIPDTYDTKTDISDKKGLNFNCSSS